MLFCLVVTTISFMTFVTESYHQTSYHQTCIYFWSCIIISEVHVIYVISGQRSFFIRS
ncbi:unnamed protein product [Musa banksii]